MGIHLKKVSKKEIKRLSYKPKETQGKSQRAETTTKASSNVRRTNSSKRSSIFDLDSPLRSQPKKPKVIEIDQDDGELKYRLKKCKVMLKKLNPSYLRLLSQDPKTSSIANGSLDRSLHAESVDQDPRPHSSPHKRRPSSKENRRPTSKEKKRPSSSDKSRPSSKDNERSRSRSRLVSSPKSPKVSSSRTERRSTLAGVQPLTEDELAKLDLRTKGHRRASGSFTKTKTPDRRQSIFSPESKEKWQNKSSKTLPRDLEKTPERLSSFSKKDEKRKTNGAFGRIVNETRLSSDSSEDEFTLGEILGRQVDNNSNMVNGSSTQVYKKSPNLFNSCSKSSMFAPGQLSATMPASSFRIPKMTGTKEELRANRTMPKAVRDKHKANLLSEIIKEIEEIKEEDLINKEEVNKFKARATSLDEDKDGEDLLDLKDSGWNELNNLKTENEKLKYFQKRFSNKVKSDPRVNLSFLGSRKRKRPDDPPRFLHDGQHLPLSEKDDVESSKVKRARIGQEEIENKLKNQICTNFLKNFEESDPSLDQKKNFRLYLRHFQKAKEETDNFMKFYAQVVF